MTLRWTRRALKNLEDEAKYIAQDDPEAARKIVLRIFNAVELLKENPAIGRPGRVPGTRELVITGTRYLIPYRARGNQVHLLRVFHTSRKWPPSDA